MGDLTPSLDLVKLPIQAATGAAYAHGEDDALTF
jgi:hypothetical protein